MKPIAIPSSSSTDIENNVHKNVTRGLYHWLQIRDPYLVKLSRSSEGFGLPSKRWREILKGLVFKQHVPGVVAALGLDAVLQPVELQPLEDVEQFEVVDAQNDEVRTRCSEVHRN